MGFYSKLRTETASDLTTLASRPLIQAAMDGRVSRESYLAFLQDVYPVVWHFCPVMAAAAARLGDDQRDLRYALYDRIEEEKGHEQWVLNDCAAVGGDSHAIRLRNPKAEIQGMIGFNYYIAERSNPCGVLGMLYMLELAASSLGGKAARGIATSTGMPGPEGFTFLGSHAVLDAKHLAELERMLDTVKDVDAQRVLINATKVNFTLFGSLFG